MTESPEEPEPGRRAEEEIEVVPATATSHSLVFLDKFTQYRIQVQIFSSISVFHFNLKMEPF